jgi:Cu/Ag efflux pump CusA
LDLKPNLSGEQNEAANGAIREALGQFSGVNFSLKTFLSERIEETLSGYQAAVVVNMYGNDLNSLDRKAREVTRVLSAIPGASGVQMQSPPVTPQFAIELRPNDIARW